MKKYEYLVGAFNRASTPPEHQKKLNEIGQDGWRLVSTVYNDAYIWFYFEREIVDNAPPI